MRKKIKVVALVGKSGAGKDYCLRKMVKDYKKEGIDCNIITSYTTRPPRDKEMNGKDYFFVSEQKFDEMVEKCDFLEYTSFNNWYYGTAFSSLDREAINIGVFNPSGVYALIKDNRIELEVIYIVCKDNLRMERILKREKNPNLNEVCRRWLADNEDFENFVQALDYFEQDYTLYINNEEGGFYI